MATLKRLKLQPQNRSDLVRQAYTAGEMAVEKGDIAIRLYDGITKGGLRIASENYVNSLVDGIVAGEVSWNSIPNKPTFATVATSGSYSDLTNKPVLFSGSYNDLTNKPVLFSGSYNDLTNKPSFPTNISSFNNDTGYITSVSLTWNNITNKPAFATVATTGSYNDLTNKPSQYSLPTASTTVLGGVKVDGTTITITDGVISSSGGSGTAYDQSLNTTDSVQFNTVTATQLLSTGTGTPTYTSSSDFIFNTGSNLGELIVNGELSASVAMSSKLLTLTPSTSAPSNPVVGMFAVANRTSWDPAGKGSGNAYPVFYNGSTWNALY